MEDQDKAFFKAFYDVFVQEGLLGDEVYALPMDYFSAHDHTDTDSQSQATVTASAVENTKGSSTADNHSSHESSGSELALVQSDEELHDSDYLDENDDEDYESSESASESETGSDSCTDDDTDVDTEETDGGSDIYDETDDSDREADRIIETPKEQPSEAASNSSHSFLSLQLRELIEKVNQLNKHTAWGSLLHAKRPTDPRRST